MKNQNRAQLMFKRNGVSILYYAFMYVPHPYHNTPLIIITHHQNTVVSTTKKCHTHYRNRATHTQLQYGDTSTENVCLLFLCSQAEASASEAELLGLLMYKTIMTSVRDSKYILSAVVSRHHSLLKLKMYESISFDIYESWLSPEREKRAFALSWIIHTMMEFHCSIGP